MTINNKKLRIVLIVIIGIIVGIANLYVFFNGKTFNYKQEWFYGTWSNETRDITITFYSNNSCRVQMHDTIFLTPWNLKEDPFPRVILNWEGMSGSYAPLFLEDKTRLHLVGMYSEEKTGVVHLTKISV